MSGLEPYIGNAPTWLGAAAATWAALQARRMKAAAGWPALLEELSGLDEGQLTALVEDNPTIAELVGVAWEEAWRTSAERKRWLLARVVARVIKGETAGIAIDETPILLRTVVALEPVHVELAIRIATPEPGTGEDVGTHREGFLSVNDIARASPEGADLLPSLLPTLER